jgi:PAS domain S-box-containing protein
MLFLPFQICWRWLVNTHPDMRRDDRKPLAELLASFLIIVILLGVAIVLFPIINHPEYLSDTSNQVALLAFVFLFYVFWLNRRGHYQAASLMTIVLLTASVFGVVLLSGHDYYELLIFLVLPVLLSSVLLSLRATTLLIVIITIGMFIMPIVLPDMGFLLLPFRYVTVVSVLILVTARSRNLIEKQRQIRLVESEQRFRHTFHDAPVGMLTTDENRHITQVNARLCKMLGYDRSELIGSPLKKIFHPEDYESHREISLQLRQQRIPYYQMERRLIAHDGSVRLAQITISVIHSDDNRPLYDLRMIEDITDRRQSEEQALRLNQELSHRNDELLALHEISRTLAATLDMNAIYAVLYHEISRKIFNTEHLVVALYDAPTRIIRYDFAIVDGEEIDLRNFVPMQLGDDPISQALQQRTPRVYRLDNPEDVAPLASDMRLAHSALYVPLISGEQAIGVINVLHYDSDAFDDYDVMLVSIIASQAAIAIQNARLFAAAQRHTEELEARVAQRTIELTKALEAEKELSELKSRFATTVSHEFRTPLATIQTSSDLLLRYSDRLTDEQKTGYLTKIQGQIKHLGGLLEDILVVSQANTVGLNFNPIVVDFEAFCRDVVEDLHLMIDDNHRIVLSTPGQPVPMEADEKLLRQIVNNLIANGIKYSPDGSVVEVHLVAEANRAVLQVGDHGIGIPETEWERVFDSFHRASNVGVIPGSGLGLAIVKHAVAAHNGQITFTSEVGIGTTFTVYLPLHQPVREVQD